MNVLDENISRIQRQLLQNWRIPVRHIGYEIGQKGMKDNEIIPFLIDRSPTHGVLMLAAPVPGGLVGESVASEIQRGTAKC
jgi:hypothetical protein